MLFDTCTPLPTDDAICIERITHAGFFQRKLPVPSGQCTERCVVEQRPGGRLIGMRIGGSRRSPARVPQQLLTIRGYLHHGVVDRPRRRGTIGVRSNNNTTSANMFLSSSTRVNCLPHLAQLASTAWTATLNPGRVSLLKNTVCPLSYIHVSKLRYVMV